jgi:hypothetical protein
VIRPLHFAPALLVALSSLASSALCPEHAAVPPNSSKPARPHRCLPLLPTMSTKAASPSPTSSTTPHCPSSTPSPVPHSRRCSSPASPAVLTRAPAPCAPPPRFPSGLEPPCPLLSSTHGSHRWWQAPHCGAPSLWLSHASSSPSPVSPWLGTRDRPSLGHPPPPC